MNFTNIARDYQEACRRVAAAIKGSKYKPGWFQQQLGFEDSPSAFYKRLKEANWTPAQLYNIGLLLDGTAIKQD